jgi:hypothetical protein
MTDFKQKGNKYLTGTTMNRATAMRPRMLVSATWAISCETDVEQHVLSQHSWFLTRTRSLLTPVDQGFLSKRRNTLVGFHPDLNLNFNMIACVSLNELVFECETRFDRFETRY